MASVIIMCVGFTLTELFLDHTAPNVIVLVVSVLLGIAIETVGIHRDRIRELILRKRRRP